MHNGNLISDSSSEGKAQEGQEDHQRLGEKEEGYQILGAIGHHN